MTTINEEEKSEIAPDVEEVVNPSSSMQIISNNESSTTAPEPEGWGFTDPRLRPFVIISITYLLFTVTDGAIRMIVLLHAYNKSFSALEVAIMFTLYEVAGVFTNLAAGVMGARWGIRFTLIIGLSLQILSYGLLFGWKDDWTKEQAIIYVTVAQMFAGIAKDLTKLGGKTESGYFLGSALLEVSYELALGFMIGLVVIAMPFAIWGLDKDLGTAKSKNSSLKEILKTDNWNLNVLSLARLFLFASRDFWFEVPLPFYLRSPNCDAIGPEFSCSMDNDEICTNGSICDVDLGYCTNVNPGGGCGGPGLQRTIVGAFLGGYIILYGQVQSWTPQLVTGPLQQTPPNKMTEVLWGMINCYPTLTATIVIYASEVFREYKYAKSDKVAVSVGFYYMSNACGRLLGTLGSGFLYTYAGGDALVIGGFDSGNDGRLGLAACFLAGTLSSLLAAIITIWIKDEEAGLNCGPCWTLVEPKEDDVTEEAKAPVSGHSSLLFESEATPCRA
eukprot:g8232.t1 g8232   contig29:53536-55299(-)